MKRFYTRVHVERAASGHQVFLDGRPLKTQGGRQQVVDSLVLAEALASEWDGQGETIDPARFAYRDMADYALDTLPKSQAQELYKKFVQFEKQRGDREGIEDVILSKRRFEYEEAVRKDAYAYDTWFDYLKLEESAGDVDRTRQLYERAIANYPPAPDKRLWRRYVYFWLKYAIFEELVAEDAERVERCIGPEAPFFIIDAITVRRDRCIGPSSLLRS